MPRRRLVAITVAGAIAGVIVVQELLVDPRAAAPRIEVFEDAGRPKIFDATETLATAMTTSASVSASAQVPRPAASAAMTSELGRQLLAAKDMKVFALEALKHPEAGGAFLATFALSHCASEGYPTLEQRADVAIRAVVDAESTISYERMAAINFWRTSCVGFSEGEVKSLLSQAGQHATDGSDPIAALARGMTTTERGTPERAKIEQAVLDSGSSTLISWTRAVEETKIDSATNQWRPRHVQAGAWLGACVEGVYCQMDLAMASTCS